MFQDVLDSTRLLKVIGEVGSKYSCRVYWKDSQESAPIFGGIVSLPKKLFGPKDVKNVSRFGFVAV